MVRIGVGKIIKTSMVTAFTIATAFIWKDVILELVKLIIPESQGLLLQFLSAVIATLIVILLIYLFLKTESEIELVANLIGRKKKKK